MSTFLPESPSFGALLGRGLGQGFSAGVGKGTDLAQQLILERAKMKQRQNLVESIKQGGSSGTASSFAQQMGQEAPQQEQSQQMDPVAEAERRAEAYAIAGEHDLSRFEAERAKGLRKESFQREKAGETKLEEIGDKLESYEQSGLRFDRLNNLFSPELESKFPPSLLAGAFTKDGELRPTAQATLSPEAQEAVKLVTDEIRGAKDTFGARVTNFDASTYLKTLPGLLNTAEGRRRVLKDLRIMNQLNQMHTNGVLDIVERYGGPSRISVSKAKGIYKKENAQKIKEMRQAFVNPNTFPFSELNDFNASLYPGVTIEDPDTGQVFSSNGQTWEPQ